MEHHFGAWVLLSLVEVPLRVSTLPLLLLDGLALVRHSDVVLVLESHLFALIPESLDLSLSFSIIQVNVLFYDFALCGLRLLRRYFFLSKYFETLLPLKGLVGSGLSLSPLMVRLISDGVVFISLMAL